MADYKFTSTYKRGLGKLFFPVIDFISKRDIDFNCKKRKGTKKLREKTASKQSKVVEDIKEEDRVIEIDDTGFPKKDHPGNYFFDEEGELVKEVGLYSSIDYVIPDHETKKQRKERLKNHSCSEVFHGEGNDIYWPPVPGIETTGEEANEVVGNMNKPLPLSPEEKARDRMMSEPTLKQLDDQFMLKAKDFRKLVDSLKNQKFDLFGEDPGLNWDCD